MPASIINFTLRGLIVKSANGGSVMHYLGRGMGLWCYRNCQFQFHALPWLIYIRSAVVTYFSTDEACHLFDYAHWFAGGISTSVAFLAVNRYSCHGWRMHCLMWSFGSGLPFASLSLTLTWTLTLSLKTVLSHSPMFIAFSIQFNSILFV